MPGCAVSFLSFVLLLFGALRLPAQAAQSVALEWDPSTDPVVAGYNVYCGTASRDYDEVISVGDVSMAVVTNLLEGQTYFFAITAIGTNGTESPFSNEVEFTIPAATTLAAPPLVMNPIQPGAYPHSFNLSASGSAPPTWELQATVDFVHWNAILISSDPIVNPTVVVSPSGAMFFRLQSNDTGSALPSLVITPTGAGSATAITATGIPTSSWVLQASSDWVNWNTIATGNAIPVQAVVINGSPPQMFFRLKSD